MEVRKKDAVDAGLWVFLTVAVAFTALVGYCEMVGYFAPIARP